MEKEFVRLDFYCDSVRDGTHDTPKPTEQGMPLVTSKAIRGGKVFLDECYLISQKDFDKINKRSLVEKWDVLMTMIGTVGRLLLVKDTPHYAIKNIALFKIGNELKAKWLYYYLLMDSVQNYFEMIANGTSQHFIGLGHMRKLKIPNVTKSSGKIVEILSTYDTLIENNTKRIRLLEKMAENLYKEWFVRFRFPGYENVEMENGLPKGWKRGSLSDVCEFKRGKNITSSEMQEGNVPVISAGLEPSGYHSCSNVRGVNVTMSSSGANAGYIAIHYSDIWAADCSYIEESTTGNIYYVYELLNNIRTVINNFQRGAAQPHVYPKDVNRIKLILPSENLMQKANARLEMMHKEIHNLQHQNSLLARQRDLLLPRLMSGKLEVKVKA